MNIDPVNDRDKDLVAFQTERVAGHYDLPAEFFASFLGPRMAYSCDYFANENDSLEKAEENKLFLTAQKLDLNENDLLLDIGCGWGSFLFYAAEKYGCRATGITLAGNQAAYINGVASQKGLSDKVKASVLHVYDMDYEPGYFDKIVTIGAIEHMDDLHKVFAKCVPILKDDGLMLVHGMTKPWEDREEELQGITTEISELVKEHFGVGYWKSLWEVMEALEKNKFEILDHENITKHYQLTTERWFERLQANEKELAGKVVPEDIYREFLVFVAGYSIGFETSHTLCNQILCRKINRGEIRPDAWLTRDRFVISSREELP